MLRSSRKHTLPKRLILSYFADWTIIIAIAAAGAGLSQKTGYQRPFYLEDPAIAFPLLDDTVSVVVLGIVAVLAPAAIILILSLALTPKPGHLRNGTVWRYKFWEWNVGWMGLGLGLALTVFVTEGLKDMTGKPRPDFLARCQPDVANYRQYIIGGLGQQLEEGINLVDQHICKNRDKSVLNDGFASWPSGHSSFSWAGMVYLSLWLCAKLRIVFPFLAPQSYIEPLQKGGGENLTLPRNRSAAPPIWLVVVAGFPIATALYISTSRYADFHHAGFDIISGAVIGLVFGWSGFRWYHLPVREGSGWAWGPRAKDRAFVVQVGMLNHALDASGFLDSTRTETRQGDLESYDGADSQARVLHPSQSELYSAEYQMNNLGSAAPAS